MRSRTLNTLAAIGASSLILTAWVTGAAERQSATPGIAALNAAAQEARRILEERQRQKYASIGWRPKRFSEKEVTELERQGDNRLIESLSQFPNFSKDDAARIRAELAQKRSALERMAAPTQYEDRFTYRTMLIVADQLEQGADAFAAAHPSVPVRAVPRRKQLVFGTLPTGAIEATVEPVNPHEPDVSNRVYLVVFETGLFRFAELLSNVVARALPSAGPVSAYLTLDLAPAAVEAHLDQHPEIVRDFEQLVHAYLLQGRPDGASQYQAQPLTEPQAGLAAFLYRGVVVFVLGHEYGHVMALEHPDAIVPNPQLPAGWSDEFFADGWGMTLSMMAGGRNVSPDMAIQGASFFFSCFDIIERGLSTIQTGQDVSRAMTDHPPANVRRERISRYVSFSLRDFWNLQPESVDEFTRMTASSQKLDVITRILWNRIQPGLLKLHADHVKVAPSWPALTNQNR